MNGLRTTDTRPFFEIRGQIGSRAVSARFVDGRLMVDEAMWQAAMNRDLGPLVEADGQAVDAIVRRPGVAMRAFLSSLDFVSYAQMGVEVRAVVEQPAGAPSAAASEVWPPPDDRSCPAQQIFQPDEVIGPRADGPSWHPASCSCGGSEIQSEYHGQDWCPLGHRESHTHLWCAKCDRQWVPDSAARP